MKVAKIQMPEGAVFTCRPGGLGENDIGATVVIEVDYGLDTGVLESIVECNEPPPGFRVVRVLSAGDEARIRENAARAEAAGKFFDRLAAKKGEGAYALSCRLSYGGGRMFIRYAAPNPVNLRRMIPELQSELHTSIDLWQLNGRAKAMRLGGIGMCGRTLCCCTWMKQIPEVTIRMMREQSLPVNPVSANGMCCKMKCCIAFEAAGRGERDAGERPKK